MAGTQTAKSRTEPSVDTTTNGKVTTTVEDLDIGGPKAEQIIATMEAVTSMFVSMINAVYKGETALAVELGSDNYAQVKQGSTAAVERVSIAVTEAITSLGREAIKAYAPIHQTLADASLLRAETKNRDSLRVKKRTS